MKLRILLALPLLLWSLFALSAEPVAWTPPTENTNGMPLNDLGGYTVYWGIESGVYNRSMEVPDPHATSVSVDIDIPIDETVYLVMTAWDTEEPRNESAYSNETVIEARERLAPIILLLLRDPCDTCAGN